MKILKKWILVGILPLLLAIGGVAYALPANEVETTYYSDASMQTEVGGSFLACQGGFNRWGKYSRYRVRFTTPCTNSGPLGIACTVDGVPTLCPPNICDSSLFTCQ